MSPEAAEARTLNECRPAATVHAIMRDLPESTDAVMPIES